MEALIQKTKKSLLSTILRSVIINNTERALEQSTFKNCE